MIEEVATPELDASGCAASSVVPAATATTMPQPQPQMAVVVPPGVVGGQMIAVTMNGVAMQVQVPMGLLEGQSFMVNGVPAQQP